MAIVKDRSKMNAIRAFINEWLKDTSLYCANCMKPYRGPEYDCCDDKYIVDRCKRVADFVRANKDERELLFFETGASKSKSIRFSIRMPYELMKALQKYFKETYQEGFLDDKKEARLFMREFPQFCACNKV